MEILSTRSAYVGRLIRDVMKLELHPKDMVRQDGPSRMINVLTVLFRTRNSSLSILLPVFPLPFNAWWLLHGDQQLICNSSTPTP
jgi:hypothetical protein